MHLRVAEVKVDTPLLSFLHQLTFASPLSLFSPTVDKLIIRVIYLLLLRTPDKRQRARAGAGVMWFEGLPSFAVLIFQVSVAVRLLL